MNIEANNDDYLSKKEKPILMNAQSARYVEAQTPDVIRVMMGEGELLSDAEYEPDEPDEVENLITTMNNKLSLLGAENSVPSQLAVSYASKKGVKKVSSRASIKAPASRGSVERGFDDYNGTISPLRRNAGSRLSTKSP